MSRTVYRITDEYALVLRPGSPVLYLQWRENGQKVRRSTGHRELEPAKRRARELILEAADIRDAQPEETPLLAVLDRYWLKHAQRAESRDTAKRAIALWREHYGEALTVAQLTLDRQEGFIEWLRGKGLADSYVRRIVGVGQTALNRARKRGEVTVTPFVELPPDGEAFPHRVTRSQIVALLNADLPPHVFTYCVIRLNTGCRGDAALDLQPFQVDFDGKEIRLNPAGRRQTKKRRPTVPLTRTLEAHLKTRTGPYYAGWQGKRTKSLKTTWRKIRTRAKLPAWFVPKALRHAVASELRRRGVPGWDVSGLLGHTRESAAATTGDYAKFDGARVRKALDAWMADLAKDVPALRGASAGPVRRTKKNGAVPKDAPFQPLKVVGGTGFEPVTPTMSRSRKIKE